MKSVNRLSFILFLFAGCATLGCKGKGPKITLCVSNPIRDGFECVRPDKSSFYLGYKKSDNYLSISPEDFKVLLEYQKLKCKE